MKTDGYSLMRRAMLVVALVSLAACGSTEPSGAPGEASAPPTGAAATPTGAPGSQAPGASPVAPTPTPSPTASPGPQDTSRFFQIEEVVFGPDSHVVLRNFTGQAATLDGLYLCDAPDCKALPDVEVPGGATAILAMGDGKGLDDVAAKDLGLTLDPVGGEIGLHASDKADVAADIRAYLEWGSTPHDGTATAIEAGLWLEGAYAPTLPTAKRLFRNEGGGWIFE